MSFPAAQTAGELSLFRADSFLIGRFDAMGCPCEILADTLDATIGGQLSAAVEEARRIEAKYSRYIEKSAIGRINAAAGSMIEVDAETADLLDFASRCHELSGGLFDVTTGILRKSWRFSGEGPVSPPDVGPLRAKVGWDKVRWERPRLGLPAGFELDLGGICKEYAADRILALLRGLVPVSVLVNLGGDIAVAGERTWIVGIEDPGSQASLAGAVRIRNGGLATSGTTKRFVTVDGKTLGHILNPKTLWPTEDAPRSVTVAARTCTEAGFWATLAVLQGAEAEAFLEEQGLEFRCYR